MILIDKITEAKNISRKRLSTEQKNQVLDGLRKLLQKEERSLLLANQEDIEKFKLSPSWSRVLEDRLQLTPKRLLAMVECLGQIAKEPDPVGSLVQSKVLPNGLKLMLRRDPFGVIFFIFEARPNVITEAFALAFKAGNSIIFKNGKEAARTSKVLYTLIAESLKDVGAGWCLGFDALSHEDAAFIMQQEKFVDLVIPRGGEKLIQAVKAQSRVPVIQNDRGLCHLYVDAEADLEMAVNILENGKTQRPSVCNALETVLVHASIAAQFLPKAFERLKPFALEWQACARSQEFLPKSSQVVAATQKSFSTEHLDLILNCRVVGSLIDAMDHIAEFGSKHSESIVTRNEATARRFQNQVDAAVAYWNASTRFTDGFEFGLGGEIGISTQKLHVRGPVGLEALTTSRWVVDGSGQIRN